MFVFGSLAVGLTMAYFIGNHNDTSALGERGVLSSGIQNHSAAPSHRGAPDHSAAPKRSTATRPPRPRSQAWVSLSQSEPQRSLFGAVRRRDVVDQVDLPETE